MFEQSALPDSPSKGVKPLSGFQYNGKAITGSAKAWKDCQSEEDKAIFLVNVLRTSKHNQVRKVLDEHQVSSGPLLRLIYHLSYSAEYLSHMV